MGERYYSQSTRDLNTLDFSYKQLGFCLELDLLNSETEIGTGVAQLVA